MQVPWIWLEAAPAGESYVLARRKFELQSAPASALLQVSANQRYRLWLNGHELGAGPAPGHPGHTWYDEYEVGHLLEAGPNVIAVLAHNAGSAFKAILNQAVGPGGLWCHLLVDGESLVYTDETWQVRPAPQYEAHNVPITGHRGGFKEFCTPQAEPEGWREAGFSAEGWQQAALLPEDALAQPTRRDIPPKRYWYEAPREVYVESGAFAYGGPYEADDLDALLDDTLESFATVRQIGDFAPALVLDFGKDAVGTFELTYEATGTGRLEIAYGESLHTTVVDHIRLAPGLFTYRPLYRRVARYVRLRFYDLEGEIRLKHARFKCESYGKPTAGAFESSDEVLNRIYQVGVHTLDCCMQDHFEDCPWREQALYAGDLRVAALLAYYAKGDYDLSRRSLKLLAETQHESGAIPTVGPAPSPLRIIPEYPAHWVGALYDYYFHSGDTALVGELFEHLVRCMEWYEGELGEAGLMEDMADSRKWFFFVDNLCGIEAQGAVTAVQAFVTQAFLLAAKLAEVAGRTDYAARWSSRAQKLQASLLSLWDEAAQAFKDNSTQAQAPERPNEISCGVPVFCEVVPPEVKLACLEILEGKRAKVGTKAGFSNFFLTEALFRSGRGAEGLARLRDYWGGMLARGATTFWEVYDPEWPEGKLLPRLGSYCHEFCAGPVYSLPAHVLGVQPLAPGFERTLVAPVPGDLSWARGKVPTPLGEVEVRWRRAGNQFTCEVRYPAGMELEVAKPEGFNCSFELEPYT